MTTVILTVRDRVMAAAERLREAGLSPREARLDAEVLARHVLGWERATFLASSHQIAPEAFGARFDQLVSRRALREPVSMITGVREFWGLEFEITRDVLIPRHESELIVEQALAAFAGRPAPRTVVDVGTGSGCLAVALATELPEARLVATDLSPPALEVAARNAARHQVADRIRFLEANFLEGLEAAADLIVSNPPYVRALDAPGLRPEVREYEPSLALYGGPDGLDALRILFGQAPDCLLPGGILVVEFGYGQEDAVRDIAAQHPALGLERIGLDLQGIARVAVARHRG